MTGTLVGLGAFFLAGLIQGCTGFGSALVAAPCLLMYFEPTFVVPVITLMSLTNTSLVAFHARRHILPGLVGPLALGGVVGSPIGITLLVVLNPDWLKVGVAAFVVAFALVLLSGWSKPIQNPKWSLLPIGLVSGILGGTTGISGPPVILFLANQGTPKEVFPGQYRLLLHGGELHGDQRAHLQGPRRPRGAPEGGHLPARHAGRNLPRRQAVPSRVGRPFPQGAS